MDVCPNVALLTAIAEDNGETVEDFHCKCEICTSQDPGQSTIIRKLGGDKLSLMEDDDADVFAVR